MTQTIIVSPFDTMFKDVLKQATLLGASDLHVEPRASKVIIRARVGGILRIIKTVEEKYVARFLMQVKKECTFDMSKVGVPDDRRFACRDIDFDCRANSTPTLYGDKTVIRFLERNKKFSLENYQMPETAKADLRRMLDKWQGLILVTGPTGSGKTTLLYSALSEIDRVENNVHTVEEPIEYTLEGATQTEVSKSGLRFGDALRSLMRQDPDVILVGEIRDEETAHAAIHAASTGHLVFSTIHANSAMESIERLVGLGIKREIAEANLLFASAQRLVPKNCPHCLVADDESKPLVKAVFGKDIVPKKSTGCRDCNFTGRTGVVLLFEHLTSEKSKIDNIKRLCLQTVLSESAIDYLKKGVINAQNACAFD